MAKVKREAISLDVSEFEGKEVCVKFLEGRQIVGKLVGYDNLVNMVIDDAVEHLVDKEDPSKLSGETRSLGRAVCRGTAVMTVFPL